MTNYFNQRIALFQIEAKDQAELFDLLSEALLKADLITGEYRQKIEEREQIYPTGLLVNGIGVAIPHTDSLYVKQSQIAFASLKNPIIFKEMGTATQAIEVKLVFMLALKEAHEQPLMLQRLVELFQKKEVLKQLLEIETIDDFLKIMADNQLE